MTPPTTLSAQPTPLPVPPALEPFLDVARAFAPSEDEDFDVHAFLRRAARPAELLERPPWEDPIDECSLFSTRLRAGGGVVDRDHDVFLGVCTDGPATVVIHLGGEAVSTLRIDGPNGGFRYAIDDEHFLPTLCVSYCRIEAYASGPTNVYLVKALLGAEPRRALYGTPWMLGELPFPFPPERTEASRVRLQGLRTRGA